MVVLLVLMFQFILSMPGERKNSALMLDLSGTVHVEDRLLPGVQEAISKVRALGIPVQFVTNTSKESLLSLGEKIRKAGLHDVDNDAIFTSLTAAKELGLLTCSKQHAASMFIMQ